MRRVLSMAAFLGVIILARIHALPASSPDEPELSPQEEIRYVLETQVIAWNHGDIEGFMKGYRNSPELLFTSGGKIRRGWQQTFDQYKATYPDRARMGELSFSDLEIHLLPSSSEPGGAPAAAWVVGKWQLKRAGDTPHGVFTLILQRFPSPSGGVTPEWKIIHDHTSSLLPEPK